MINGSFSNWEEITSGVPHSSALGLVHFNVFVNYLDEGVQGMLIRFVDDRTLGETTLSLGRKERDSKLY